MHQVVRMVVIGSLISAASASTVLAQPAAVDKQKAKTAKQYVDAGLAAQNTGDYDTAITFYQKAYDLIPHPLLLFNMAQAHRLAGRDDQAADLYNKYLSLDPNGAESKNARDILAELDAKKAKIAADKAAAEKAAADKAAADAKLAAEEKAAERARQQKAAEAQRTHVASESQPMPSMATPLEQTDTTSLQPGRTLRIAGLGVGGVGVIGVGVGVLYGLHAKSLSDDLSKPGAVYDPSKVDSGESANRNAIIGLVGGSVLVAVGATLYWRGHVAGTRVENVAVTPVINDQVAGLVVSGWIP